MIQVYIIVGVIEVFAAIFLYINWSRSEAQWRPYIDRESEIQFAVGVQRWGCKVAVTHIHAKTDNFADELAKAEAEARDKAILLNSTTRSLEKVSK